MKNTWHIEEIDLYIFLIMQSNAHKEMKLVLLCVVGFY